MKRGKKMVLLLIALAVFIGGYFGVQKLVRKEKVTEKAGSFSLTEHKADEMTGLDWSENDHPFSIKCEDGVWKPTGPSAWAVNQDTMKKLANRLTELQGVRKLDHVTQLADYGLEKPAFSVKASWKDGGSLTYSLGDATPFSDGFYLHLSDQANTVYIIRDSLSSIFNVSGKDIVATEAIPAVEDAVCLKLGDALNIRKKDESMTLNPEQLWYDQAADTPLDKAQVESLIKEASEITWNDVVSTSASEDELKTWKLDDASAKALTLENGKKDSRMILFGAQNESGDYYARLPGSTMVYTVRGKSVSKLFSASVDSLWSGSFLSIPYESLESVEFTTGKGTYKMTADAAQETKTEENSKAEAGGSAKAEADGTAETEAGGTAEAEGRSKADEDKRNLWAKVSNLQATSRLPSVASGNQLLSIRVLNKAGKTSAWIFTEYNAESYQALQNNGSPLLVPAETVDLLIRTINSMI